MLHGTKKPAKAKKVLGKGPMKVANKGPHAMGTTIGKGKTMMPRGSDSSKVKGNGYNGRKYEMTRKAVFGLGRSK